MKSRSGLFLTSKCMCCCSPTLGKKKKKPRPFRRIFPHSSKSPSISDSFAGGRGPFRPHRGRLVGRPPGERKKKKTDIALSAQRGLLILLTFLRQITTHFLYARSNNHLSIHHASSPRLSLSNNSTVQHLRVSEPMRTRETVRNSPFDATWTAHWFGATADSASRRVDGSSRLCSAGSSGGLVALRI